MYLMDVRQLHIQHEVILIIFHQLQFDHIELIIQDLNVFIICLISVNLILNDGFDPNQGIVLVLQVWNEMTLFECV